MLIFEAIAAISILIVLFFVIFDTITSMYDDSYLTYIDKIQLKFTHRKQIKELHEILGKSCTKWILNLDMLSILFFKNHISDTSDALKPEIFSQATSPKTKLNIITAYFLKKPDTFRQLIIDYQVTLQSLYALHYEIMKNDILIESDYWVEVKEIIDELWGDFLQICEADTDKNNQIKELEKKVIQKKKEEVTQDIRDLKDYRKRHYDT